MLKVHHRLLCGREFDDPNWLVAPDAISAAIMEGPAAGALFLLLIGFIVTSGLIDEGLRHFKFLKHRFLWTYPLFFVFRLLGVFFFARSVAFYRARCEPPARQLCSPQRD